MFHYGGKKSLTCCYASAVSGKNHSLTDVFNVK